jgi:hypothetical protein
MQAILEPIVDLAAIEPFASSFTRIMVAETVTLHYGLKKMLRLPDQGGRWGVQQS